MLAVSQFRLRRTRRVVPVVLGAIALALGAAPVAGAATALAPPVDGIGCLGGAGLTGCTAALSLNGAAGVALSPDGRNGYVAARDANAVTVLGRDTAGRLSLTSCLATGSPGCTTARAITGAIAVDVSRDGRLVAVAAPGANGVAVFLRDTTTGLLTQPAGAAGCATETGDGGTCLDGRTLSGARDVAFSADGTRLYVAAQTANAVAVLATDPAVGITSQPAGAAGCVSETGTAGLCGDGWSLFAPSSVAALPTGVLVATSTSGSLVRLNLNTGTGALSQPSGATGCIRDTGTGSCPDGRALAGATDITITPDGTAALVTAATSDAVARIGLGATLTQAGGVAGCVSETGLSGQCLDGRALDGAASVAVSPDGRTVYAAATSNDTVAVLDLSASGFAQGADSTGCVSDRGGSGCATRSGLDGARGVAVDDAGRPVTAAETSDTVLAHRLNRPPSCTAATAEATWERAITVTPVCSDPDGDPLTLRLTSVPTDSAVALAGGVVTVNPRRGETTTLSIGVAASDGTLSSAAVTLTVKITAPPPIPPKPVPSLPATLSAPLLGIERRPLDLAKTSTTLPTFCLPRRATSCSGTVELLAGSRALGATPATGPGQVTLALAPAARRALRTLAHAGAVSRAVTPAGWATTRAASESVAIALPVRRARAGTKRTGTQLAEQLRGRRRRRPALRPRQRRPAPRRRRGRPARGRRRQRSRRRGRRP
ncbi:lactonase family protein [Svornostia abyssi]|uniref:Lactonase family protein n=1 Tax=Svornostia abyssi TaxID=2898438 RepID=A0ABY5PIU2_9ACTN|nr:lactonase family protein [Parviterribacteraceae bacterium J379]